MLRIFLKAFGLDWLLPVPFKIQSVKEIHNLMRNENILLIDVRAPDEVAKTGLPEDSTNVSLSKKNFVEIINELFNADKHKSIALTCHAGNRTKEAAFKLHDAGFKNLIAVDGGIIDWLKSELPIKSENK